jgi:zinc transport system permease protein
LALSLLDYPFMKSALFMGLVLGVLFSLMGIFVVTKGMSFFSDFIAHSAILGGALAILADVEPAPFLVLYSLFIAFTAAAIWNHFPLSRDTVLGVLYGGTVASGLILITTLGLGQSSLMGILFGDILLVKPVDIWLSSALLGAFALFLGVKFRGLIKSSFLPEISRAEGIRVGFYDYALITLIAVTIALSIKLIGVILANAMVVIPAAAAKTLSGSLRQFMVIAPLLGVASFLIGIILSFRLNLPSGPSVIATAFLFFIAALAVKTAWRR